MSQAITTNVIGNVEAIELIQALAHLGISREQIRIHEPDAEPEHGTDTYGTWNLTWGVIGGSLGAFACWMVMAWSPVPWIGALWGAVVGALCGARYGGYAVSGNRPGATRLHLTRVEIDVADEKLIKPVRTICSGRDRSIHS